MAEDAIEPLVTECPNCHTRFRVTEAQLTLAGGRVRCGACLMVFTGTEYLVFDADDFLEGTREEADAALDALLSELTAEPETVTDAVDESEEKPVGDEPVTADVAAEAGEVESVPMAGVAGGSAGDEGKVVEGAAPDRVDAAQSPPYDLPTLDVDPDELVAGSTEQRRPVRWWVPVGIVAGLAVLVAQVLWFQFDTWVQDPDMRPLYERICPVIGCDLPVLRDVRRFYTKELVVRSHPSAADALMVDALIVNDAPFEQPFPVLELRFSAMGGQLVAARRFRPEEYLEGELDGARTIPPRTPVHISLEIEDPGTDAVNYVMVFR